jgi:hypothetical protein
MAAVDGRADGKRVSALVRGALDNGPKTPNSVPEGAPARSEEFSDGSSNR